jgi:hypothetical protein
MDEVKVISTERLEKGTIRIMVEVKGHLFKRLSFSNYPVVWYDEYGTFNDCQAMKPEQEKELESIFKAWMIENKTDESKLLIKQ